MDHLIVGVCQLDLFFRHATSLKDKRQILQSIETRLRNQGFSVTHIGGSDNPQRGGIGLAYAGHHYPTVETALEKALQLFVGGVEVLHSDKEILEYEESQAFEVLEEGDE